ncbi:MAG: hypothetical protein IJP92_00725 [Lachnospiraceae bacterium]|nr:hypothetical protein [Lachnospiraceae bacterium]
MIVYRCDKCKKILEKHEEMNEVRFYMTEDKSADFRKDLCDCCMTKLINWMEEGE